MRKRAGWIASLAAGLLVVIVLYGPGYLIRADRTTHADAVVVFVGPGDEFRFREARRLLAEGYARYLIVPAYGMVTRAAADGSLQPLMAEPRRRTVTVRKPPAPGYKSYVENTHIEAILARQALDRLGIRSALLVSSPFHTRRIGMISSRVFSKDYRISVVPSRFQDTFTVRDWFIRDHLEKIAGEYTKMVWFLLYETFSRQSG